MSRLLLELGFSQAGIKFLIAANARNLCIEYTLTFKSRDKQKARLNEAGFSIRRSRYLRRFSGEITQHIVQDTAMFEIFMLIISIDTHIGRDGFRFAISECNVHI